MTPETVKIDSQLWASLSKEASKQRKHPQNLLAEIIRDYIERTEDQRWWRAIQRQSQGRAVTDAEASEFVRRYRRDKFIAKRDAKHRRSNSTLRRSLSR